jgi:hypothetical protein
MRNYDEAIAVGRRGGWALATNDRSDMGTRLRDALTGYGECRRVPCRARFRVGYPAGVANAEPVVTDDTATGTRCPNLLA